MDSRTPLLLLFIIIFSICKLNAQEDSQTAAVTVTGTASVSLGIYSFESTDSNFRARRPPFNYQVAVNPTIKFSDKFSLPIRLVLSKRQQQILFPLPQIQSPLEYITNPNNSIGLSPIFGNIQLHLGTHQVQFSGLTIGNLPIFGAGFNFRPEKYQLAASYGFANFGYEPDTLNNIPGAYRRKVLAVRGRLGKEDKTYIGFNFASMGDDTVSIRSPIIGIPPEEGLLGSVDFRLNLGKYLYLEGEGAGSIFSSDLNALELSEQEALPRIANNDLFTLRLSTSIDYAYSGAINIDFKTAGAKFAIRNISPGFRTFGFPFMQADIRDITFSPFLNLKQNKIRLSGTVGYRADNLRETKIGTSTNLLLSGNLFAQISERFNLSANYSNFGLRNNIDNDTFKIENIARNISLSPSYIIQGKQASHSFNVTLAQSAFEDFNFATQMLNQNNTLSFVGIYVLTYGKINVSLNGSYIYNDRITDNLEIRTGGVRIGYNWPKQRIRVATNVSYTITDPFYYTPDKMLKVQPSIRWGVSQKMNLQASYYWRNYQYGNLRNNSEFSENFLQLSLNQRF